MACIQSHKLDWVAWAFCLLFSILHERLACLLELIYMTDFLVWAVHSLYTMWGTLALHRVLSTYCKGHLIMGRQTTIDHYSVNSGAIRPLPQLFSGQIVNSLPLCLLPGADISPPRLHRENPHAFQHASSVREYRIAPKVPKWARGASCIIGQESAVWIGIVHGRFPVLRRPDNREILYDI